VQDAGAAIDEQGTVRRSIFEENAGLVAVPRRHRAAGAKERDLHVSDRGREVENGVESVSPRNSRAPPSCRRHNP
jgi:hypothetical protein